MDLLSKFGATKISQSANQQIYYVPLEQIQADSEQPRKVFNEEKLEKLAESIRTHGIHNPIHLLCIGPKSYKIITGERRFRASQLVGKDSIPAIVWDKDEIDEKKIRVLQYVENIQREDLTPLEQAKGIKQILESQEITQSKLAEELGVSIATISKMISILNLPKEMIDEIEEFSKTKNISKSIIYELASDDNGRRRNSLWEKIKEGTLVTEKDVREAKKGVRIEQQEENQQSEGLDENLDSDKVWEALKRAVKKDKKLLLKFLTSKKLEKLMEEFGKDE